MSGKCKNCFYAYKSNYWTYKCKKNDDKRVLANNRATCFVSKTAHKLGVTPKEAYKGMTNGEVIMALFPNALFENEERNIVDITIGDKKCTNAVVASAKQSWLNAPYESETEK